MLITTDTSGTMNSKNARTATIQRERKKVLVALLTATGMFEGISEEERLKIARLFSERAYPKGATIYSEGDPSDAVYILNCTSELRPA